MIHNALFIGLFNIATALVAVFTAWALLRGLDMLLDVAKRRNCTPFGGWLREASPEILALYFGARFICRR